MGRSPKLPAGWKYVTLLQVAEVFNGKTPSESEKRKDGKPILKIKDVSDSGKFKGNFDSFVDSEFYDKHKTKVLKYGDTLILNAAHNSEYVGSKTFYVRGLPSDTIATGEWLVIRAKPEMLDMRFKHYVMTSAILRKKLRDKVKGIHLYPNDVKELEIPLPPFPTQQEIASILKKAEQAKQLRREVEELTREFLKAVFLELFGNPVLNDKKFESIELWRFCEKITDGEHLNPQLQKHGKPLIMAKDVLEDDVDFSQNHFVSEEDFEKYVKKCKPEQGDLLLVSRGATIGRCTSVKTSKPFCLMGSVILIKPRSIDVKFLEYLFKDSNFIKKVVNVSGASAQQAIYLRNLKKLTVVNPPHHLQQRFASIVKEVERMKEQQRHSKKQIDTLFDAVMQKAFTGELVA